MSIDRLTTNWNTGNVSGYLKFYWRCENDTIRSGEIVKVILRLVVSPQIVGISTFSFNIIFNASTYHLGDINRDGIIDIYDIALVTSQYGEH